VKHRFLGSFPKSGTHLMRHILGMEEEQSHLVPIMLGNMTSPINVRFYENGISGHLACHPFVFELLGDMPKFFIIRDPRDIIVSWAHFASKIGYNHVLARLYNLDNQITRVTGVNHYDIVDVKSAKDKIMALIKTVCPFMQGFLDWPNHATTVRYEKLLSDPEEELAPVAEILDEPLDMLVERSKFRGGKTFRKGVAGEWKKEFQYRHNTLFNEIFADVMERWGYEI